MPPSGRPLHYCGRELKKRPQGVHDLLAHVARPADAQEEPPDGAGVLELPPTGGGSRVWRLGGGEERAEPVRETAVSAGREGRPAARSGFSIALLLFLFGASLVVPALAFTAVLLDRSAQEQEADIRRRLNRSSATSRATSIAS